MSAASGQRLSAAESNSNLGDRHSGPNDGAVSKPHNGSSHANVQIAP
jgi:hypothetical protein